MYLFNKTSLRLSRSVSPELKVYDLLVSSDTQDLFCRLWPEHLIKLSPTACFAGLSFRWENIERVGYVNQLLLTCKRLKTENHFRSSTFFDEFLRWFSKWLVRRKGCKLTYISVKEDAFLSCCYVSASKSGVARRSLIKLFK